MAKKKKPAAKKSTKAKKSQNTEASVTRDTTSSAPVSSPSTREKTSAIDTILNIAIVVLSITAVYLGYQIYREWMPPTVTSESKDSMQDESQTQDNSAQNGGVPDNVKSLIAGGESGDIDYFARIREMAKDTGAVTITSCKADPVVTMVEAGETITFTNNDASETTLRFGTDLEVTIPAGGKKDVPLEFVSSEGIYTYNCNTSSDPAGLLYTQ